MAERYQVSAAHDVDDRVWDYPDRTPEERWLVRRAEDLERLACLESISARGIAEVDVIKVHRVINGVAETAASAT